MTLPPVLVDATRDNFSNSTGMRCCSYMESENCMILDISLYIYYINARDFALIQFYNATTISEHLYDEAWTIPYLFFTK